MRSPYVTNEFELILQHLPISLKIINENTKTRKGGGLQTEAEVLPRCLAASHEKFVDSSTVREFESRPVLQSFFIFFNCLV